MKAITYRVAKGVREMNIYLLGDWHWGSPQCRKNDIRKLVKRIADDPKALWIGCGDLAENALITSVGDVYKQEVSPQSQLGQLVLLLEPIADKCLAMVGGNHGARTTKGSGLDPDHVLAALLRLGDLVGDPGKYCGYSSLIDLCFEPTPTAITHWVIYLHHGAGGGRTKGGKTNAASRGVEIVEGADILITAHHHADISFSDRISYISNGSGEAQIKWRRRHYTSVLSALEYGESYAEAKQMPPASLGQVVLTLGGRKSKRHDKSMADAYEKPYKREVIWF